MSEKSEKVVKKILFLCTGNSCRSQMAEGWCRVTWSSQVESFSAGIETHGVNPRAVVVMAEKGVDISKQRSQHIDEFRGEIFDLVVTVCSHAANNCPVLKTSNSFREIQHVNFDDPPSLSEGMIFEDDILEVYRRVRDEIRDFVQNIKL